VMLWMLEDEHFELAVFRSLAQSFLALVRRNRAPSGTSLVASLVWISTAMTAQSYTSRFRLQIGLHQSLV